MSGPAQLRTYPSPSPTITLTCYWLTILGLGGGVGTELLRY